MVMDLASFGNTLDIVAHRDSLARRRHSKALPMDLVWFVGLGAVPMPTLNHATAKMQVNCQHDRQDLQSVLAQPMLSG